LTLAIGAGDLPEYLNRIQFAALLQQILRGLGHQNCQHTAANQQNNTHHNEPEPMLRNFRKVESGE
jgi:hypothetical protein